MEGSISGGKGGFEFIPVEYITQKTGASEPGVRFLLGLLVGSLFAIGFHLIVPKSNSFAKHLYFTACGLMVSYFCFGADTIHSMISVLVTYATLNILGGGRLSLVLMIVFHMGYLITSYIVCSSDSYDIKWTTPQCVLCLRLMGLAWDMYDGVRDKASLSEDQKTTYLEGPPGFLEICGYTYFYGGYLCGPQFPMRRYKQFVANELIDVEAEKKGPSRYTTGIKRLLFGLLFVVLFITSNEYFRSDFPATKEFKEAPFLKQCFYLVCWKQVLFFKYIFSWLCAEASCMLTGISYNGKTESGNARWDGVKNFSVYTYYTGYTISSMVTCVNISTNQWVSRYVFKRLRFLGNKDLSHILTLQFLAIWHGFYVGYFMAFFLEFFCIFTERQIYGCLYRITGTSLADLPLVIRAPLKFFLAFVKFYCVAFSVVSFSLLRWRRIQPVWKSHYYFLILFLASWQAISPIIRTLLASKRESKEHKDEATKKIE